MEPYVVVINNLLFYGFLAFVVWVMYGRNDNGDDE